MERADVGIAGTCGQVGHRTGERTAGRRLGLGRDLVTPGRGGRTAAAATDLQGVAGGGPETGSQPAKTDAAKPVEHAGQRTAGHASQCWPQDRGHRRAGRVDLPGQGFVSGGYPPPHGAVASPSGQAGVHPEGGWEAAATGDSGAAGSGVTGPCRQRAGARVGGTVRTTLVWVPARAWLP